MSKAVCILMEEAIREELARICTVDGNRCDLRRVSDGDLERMRRLLLESGTDDPVYRAFFSLYCRCLAVRFEGIPTPSQLQTVMRADIQASVILLFRSICTLESTPSCEEDTTFSDKFQEKSLECYYQRSLTECSPVVPDYEDLVSWIWIFQNVCEQNMRGYCFSISNAK